MSKPCTYYTIYNDLTEEIIAYGTREECIEKLKLTPGSFSSMISNIKNGTNRKYKNYAVVIEYYDPQHPSDEMPSE